MNHAEAHSHMADYLEGDLDLTKRALLDAHLDACEGCSREFAEMRGTIALLRGLPDPEPPPFLAETVMRRVREGKERLGFGDRLRGWIETFASPQIALPATALAVGLMMATGIFDQGSLPGFGDEATPSIGIQIVTSPTDLSRPDRLLATGRAPHLAVGNAPPAIARVPRISISLPTPGSRARTRIPSQMVANGGARAPRVVTGWSTRSIRNAPGLADPQALSVPVGNRVSLGVGSEQLRAQSSAFAPGSREARRAAELDKRIDHMIRRPITFAAEFSRFSVAEQEIWLPALAERAHEASRGDDALEALRLAGDRQAEKLATAFLAELRQARDRPEVAALQQGAAALQQGAAALQEEREASQR